MNLEHVSGLNCPKAVVYEVFVTKGIKNSLHFSDCSLCECTFVLAIALPTSIRVLAVEVGKCLIALRRYLLS